MFTRVVQLPDDGTGNPYTAAADDALGELLTKRGWSSISAGPEAGEDAAWEYASSFEGDDAEAALDQDPNCGPTAIAVAEDGASYIVTDPYGRDTTYTDRNQLLADLTTIESWRFTNR